MAVKSICGVILAARDPRALATFYAEALGIAFEREQHGGLEEHFGADIAQVHFGIHPPANLHKDAVGNASEVVELRYAFEAPQDAQLP